MKRMKDIIIGILIGCMLMTVTPVLADSVLTKIDVVLNGINVQVEGQGVEVDSILYNGTTYLPMRKVAELVGKDIEWKQETKTANIVEKTDVKEGEDVVEQTTEDYKVIEEKDGYILTIEKGGKEYYSWEKVARLVKPYTVANGGRYFWIAPEGEYTILEDTVPEEQSLYIQSVKPSYFISKDYYDSTILPLINK